MSDDENSKALTEIVAGTADIAGGGGIAMLAGQEVEVSRSRNAARSARLTECPECGQKLRRGAHSDARYSVKSKLLFVAGTITGLSHLFNSANSLSRVRTSRCGVCGWSETVVIPRR